MAGELHVVLVGGDELALDVLRELRAAGDEVELLWKSPCRIAEEAARLGAHYRDADPEILTTWEHLALPAGSVIVCIAQADDFNITVGLLAREAHPGVRLILRQFDRRMASELERILPNAGVVAIADVAAATYAAAVLNPHVISAFRFPEAGDALLAFASGTAADFGCAGAGPRMAGEHLRGRVMEVNGRPPEERPLDGDDELIVFAPVARLAQIARLQPIEPSVQRPRRRRSLRSLVRRFDPVTLSVGAALVLLFVVATLFYGTALHLGPLDALYVVTSRVAENGDVSLWHAPPLVEGFTIAVMIAGIALTSSVVALLTNAIVRRREELVAGMRRIRARGHVVVCGSGVVGSRVVEYLLALDVPVRGAQPRSRAGRASARSRRQRPDRRRDARTDARVRRRRKRAWRRCARERRHHESQDRAHGARAAPGDPRRAALQRCCARPGRGAPPQRRHRSRLARSRGAAGRRACRRPRRPRSRPHSRQSVHRRAP